MAWLLNGCGSKVAAKFHKPIWIREICVILKSNPTLAFMETCNYSGSSQQNNHSKKTKNPKNPVPNFSWKTSLNHFRYSLSDVGRRKITLSDPIQPF